MRRSGYRARAAVLAAVCLTSLVACTTTSSPFLRTAAPTFKPAPTDTPLPTEQSNWATVQPSAGDAWTPEPTDTPEVWAPQIGELAIICGGQGFAEAPRYKGSPHPVAVVDMGEPTYPVMIGITGPTGPIQLVVCVGPGSLVKTGSCGLYKRSSDGKVGYVYKYKQARTLTVRAALDGKKLTASTLYGNSASCNSTFSIDNYPPPWTVSGGPVTEATIMAYALSASKMKA